MSVAELLRHVRALSGRERRRLLLEVLKLESASPTDAERRGKPVKWPDVAARAKRVCGERVLPNLVLLERSEELL